MKIGRKFESKTFYSNIGWENNVHNTSVPYYIDLRFTKSYACFTHIINYSCAFFSALSSTKFNRRKTPFHYLLEFTLLFPPNSLSLIYIHTTPQIKAHLVFSALSVFLLASVSQLYKLLHKITQTNPLYCYMKTRQPQQNLMLLTKSTNYITNLINIHIFTKALITWSLR